MHQLGSERTTRLDVTVLIPDLGLVHAVSCNLLQPSTSGKVTGRRRLPKRSQNSKWGG
jgi:hypothetical protein